MDIDSPCINVSGLCYAMTAQFLQPGRKRDGTGRIEPCALLSFPHKTHFLTLYVSAQVYFYLFLFFIKNILFGDRLFDVD